MNGDPRAQFAEANRLWFEQGATGRAVELYESVARSLPDDPVVGYQLALSLWALGRDRSAAVALASAEEHVDRLTPLGLKLLARLRRRLESAAPRPSFLSDRSALDVDVLEARGLAPAQWLEVAYAARERDMFGLAAHAFARSSSFQSAELDRDEHEARQAASTWHQALDEMRIDRWPQAPADPAQPSTSSPPVSSPPSPPVPPPSPPPARADPRRIVRAPILAPSITIAVTPPVSGVTDQLELAVTLGNPGKRPLAVNGRLLVNSPDAPHGYGELSISVQGPVGYVNATRFSVRAGLPEESSFVLLAPDAEIRASYRLHSYESLHLAGVYRLWVTYHNEVPGSAHGQPAFLGAVSSTAVEIERRHR